jgi:myo-inositol-1(or 4)-monophosphatase
VNETNDLRAGDVLDLFRSISERTADLVAANLDWSESGERVGQYAVDLGVDEVCLEILHDAGWAVLSEESGITGADGSSLAAPPNAIVVVDPLDGSTNAALGLPWCATSLCLVVDGVPTVAHVVNLRTGARYEAVAGEGATSDGGPISVDAGDGQRGVVLADAIVAVNARPPASFVPRQFRAMGSTALDVASVAAPGGFDGYVDFDDDMIGVWDYLAAVLIVTEAGGVVADALGRDLVTLDPTERRRPVAARSARLLDELLVAAKVDR